jgi:hypothetical protein
MSTAPSAPPPYVGAPMAWGGGGVSPPPPRRRSRILVIVAIIVAVILVVAIVAVLFVPPGPSIQVTYFYIDSVDNVCDLDGATASGFNASTGDLVAQDFGISGANATAWTGTLACNITSLTTPTPGFSLTGVDVPLVVPANATVDLTFSVQCPNSDYTGNLTLDMG